MVKRNTTLTLDDELVLLAKTKNINISSFVNNVLEAELTNENLYNIENKDILINKLKGRISILTDELKLLNEKNELLTQEIKSIKDNQIKKKKDKKEKIIMSVYDDEVL
jgi:hypothetical protein